MVADALGIRSWVIESGYGRESDPNGELLLPENDRQSGTIIDGIRFIRGCTGIGGARQTV